MIIATRLLPNTVYPPKYYKNIIQATSTPRKDLVRTFWDNRKLTTTIIISIMASYETVLTNNLTGERAVISSNNPTTFNNKLAKKELQWEKQNKKVRGHQSAKRKTLKAKKEIDKYKKILESTLSIDDKIDWDSIKIAKHLEEPTWEEPISGDSAIVTLSKIPIIGNFSVIQAAADESILHKAAKRDLAFTKYERDFKKYKKKIENWEKKYSQLQEGYEKGEKEWIEKYFDLVLEQSEYPANLNLTYNILFDSEQSLFVVDIDLPLPEDLPRVLEYRYIQARDETKAMEMKDTEFNKFYNDLIFQIVIRTLHEIEESDYSNQVELMVVNGKLEKINRKTGHTEIIHIASVQVTKEDFSEISLGMIEPDQCFRHLKGITAGELVSLSPIKPIMKINREDGRIIKADSIVDQVNENDNLAQMDWQEFEVLVRDLIQKEFSHEGCQVEVTRASRDAGVDAIAFDEDPIRGGKYVIQAKRYNNLVPLTAVRDLYGTVMNEGAVKGILITTSYYGKDALEFVKDKPLTLINGEELLYMFNKHGYNFRIELKKKQKKASRKTY